MKRVAVVAGWLFFGCLKPVAEGVDAGPCREFLGVADAHRSYLESAFSGEHRDGRYFFGPGILIDDRTFKPIDERQGVVPVVWPCTGLMSSSWLLTPEATYLKFSIPKNRRSYVLLYRYTDQLQAQIDEGCVLDGGFGPATVRLDLTPDRYLSGGAFRGAALAETSSGFLACSAQLDDAGAPRDMVLYRTDDGGVLSSLASSAEHCFELRPPLALTFSFDGGGEFINFDTRRQVANLGGGNCRLTRDGAALCGTPGAATLVSGQGSTELAREEGAAYLPIFLSVREPQYVARVSADGGYAWYWFRNGALELLDEGMRESSIGDFDDQNIFYVVAGQSLDAGRGLEFERRCLPK